MKRIAFIDPTTRIASWRLETEEEIQAEKDANSFFPQEPVNWKELAEVHGEIVDRVCDSLWNLLYRRTDWNSPDEVVGHVQRRILELENDKKELADILQDLLHKIDEMVDAAEKSGFFDQHGKWIPQGKA